MYVENRRYRYSRYVVFILMHACHECEQRSDHIAVMRDCISISEIECNSHEHFSCHVLGHVKNRNYIHATTAVEWVQSAVYFNPSDS